MVIVDITWKLENNNIDFIQEHIKNIKKEKEIILDLKKNMDAKSLVKKQI